MRGAIVKNIHRIKKEYLFDLGIPYYEIKDCYEFIRNFQEFELTDDEMDTFIHEEIFKKSGAAYDLLCYFNRKSDECRYYDQRYGRLYYLLTYYYVQRDTKNLDWYDCNEQNRIFKLFKTMLTALGVDISADEFHTIIEFVISHQKVEPEARIIYDILSKHLMYDEKVYSFKAIKTIMNGVEELYKK
jgi:hypothetical protein